MEAEEYTSARRPSGVVSVVEHEVLATLISQLPPSHVVVFDLFGVIARHQDEAGRSEITRLVPSPPSDFWDAYWAERQHYDCGDYSAQRYWGAVFDRLGLGACTQVEALVAADLRSWSGVDQSMVDLVCTLGAARRRLALLSNIPEDLAADFEARSSWLRVFEYVFFSAREGLTKPDARAFCRLERHLSTPGKKLLLVDDRRENVEAAIAAGWRAVLFIPTDHVE